MTVEHALDRLAIRLHLPPAVAGAVIGDNQFYTFHDIFPFRFYQRSTDAISVSITFIRLAINITIRYSSSIRYAI